MRRTGEQSTAAGSRLPSRPGTLQPRRIRQERVILVLDDDRAIVIHAMAAEVVPHSRSPRAGPCT